MGTERQVMVNTGAVGAHHDWRAVAGIAGEKVFTLKTRVHPPGGDTRWQQRRGQVNFTQHADRVTLCVGCAYAVAVEALLSRQIAQVQHAVLHGLLKLQVVIDEHFQRPRQHIAVAQCG